MFNQEVRDVTVSELRTLYESNEYEIEIDTPDGFQPITHWWDKGVLPMIEIATENTCITKCAMNHLLQRANGDWMLASALTTYDTIITHEGNSRVISILPADDEACFDFEVSHPNHRYWGDGLSSHNSGKSYIVSGTVVRNALEQGVSVVLLDSEDAVKRRWAEALGVDPDHSNLIRWNKNTINQCALVIADFMKDYANDYRNVAREDQPPVLMVIDSLGNLNSDVEAEQFSKGDLRGDKGIKAKGLKMLVTNAIRLFSGFQVGLVCTNHTYKSQDMYAPDDVISGGCLTDRMKIKMADGETKSIADVMIGDNVETLFGVKPVINAYTYQKPVYILELSDGQIIECTGEHSFLVSDETGYQWKSAEDIIENDEVISVSPLD